MKYKVIGWTNYDDGEFPEGECSRAAFRAIVDDVRENGYDFSGYSHQECFDCTPVLNTGERMCFSSRGWGRVMAEAHGHFGVYDYSNYSFGMEETDKTPTCFFIDESKVLPLEELYETYRLTIDDADFETLLKENQVIIPDADYIRYIDVGDTVILDNNGRIAEYKVDGVLHGRDKNEGEGRIDFISENDIEISVYSHDEYRDTALELYKNGKRSVCIHLK